MPSVEIMMPSVEIAVPSVEMTALSALNMTSRSAVRMEAPGVTAADRVTATAGLTAAAGMAAALWCCGDRRRQREYEHRRQSGFSAAGLN
jgi:hypothetical protein